MKLCSVETNLSKVFKNKSKYHMTRDDNSQAIPTRGKNQYLEQMNRNPTSWTKSFGIEEHTLTLLTYYGPILPKIPHKAHMKLPSTDTSTRPSPSM